MRAITEQEPRAANIVLNANDHLPIYLTIAIAIVGGLDCKADLKSLLDGHLRRSSKIELITKLHPFMMTDIQYS